jgi:outer membrane protein OmpA-like peptidoglycan-associated protein
MTAEGYGKSSPIADNSTNAGRAQNRRVQQETTQWVTRKTVPEQ